MVESRKTRKKGRRRERPFRNIRIEGNETNRKDGEDSDLIFVKLEISTNLRNFIDRGIGARIRDVVYVF